MDNRYLIHVKTSCQIVATKQDLAWPKQESFNLAKATVAIISAVYHISSQIHYIRYFGELEVEYPPQLFHFRFSSLKIRLTIFITKIISIHTAAPVA
jgi:hypothetical protein